MPPPVGGDGDDGGGGDGDGGGEANQWAKSGAWKPSMYIVMGIPGSQKGAGLAVVMVESWEEGKDMVGQYETGTSRRCGAVGWIGSCRVAG
mmetsp:Transcript_31638/g.92767  ORF Transcript_31638/g.92767 Transcript_31638/m.92767 type:complete len:91 (-) Transcript_31638:209-481(-)